MTGRIDGQLEALGIRLPPPPSPAGSYRPFNRWGSLVQLSGVAPTEDGRYAVVGKVGADLDIEAGQRAARLCALNLLASLHMACEGDLDRVKQILMVRGFVNAADDFTEVPSVMNGASDLLVSVFGPEIGGHARTSIGCATLPGRVAVEVDALVELDTAS